MGSGMITCMSRGPFHPGRPTPGRPTDRSSQRGEELRARSVKPRRGKRLFRVDLWTAKERTGNAEREKQKVSNPPRTRGLH